MNPSITTADARSFQINSFIGKIVGDPQKIKETANNYLIDNTTHDNFFVQLSDGKEKSLALKNWDLNIRQGHELMFVWLTGPGASENYIAIKNITTDQLYIKDSVLEDLALKPKPMFPEGADTMQTGCLTLAIIILTLGIGYFIWMSGYNRKMKIFEENKQILKRGIVDYINNY